MSISSSTLPLTNDVLALTCSSSDMSTTSSTNGSSDTNDSSSPFPECDAMGSNISFWSAVGAVVGLCETGEDVGVAVMGDRLGEAVGVDVIGASVGSGVFRGGSVAAAEELTLPTPPLGRNIFHEHTKFRVGSTQFCDRISNTPSLGQGIGPNVFVPPEQWMANLQSGVAGNNPVIASGHSISPSWLPLFCRNRSNIASSLAPSSATGTLGRAVGGRRTLAWPCAGTGALRVGEDVGLDVVGEDVGLDVVGRDVVGCLVGMPVGIRVGARVGAFVGGSVGLHVGPLLGLGVGDDVGLWEGDADGCDDGRAVGTDEGAKLGPDEGLAVGEALGLDDGSELGDGDGRAVGAADMVGKAEGLGLGISVGAEVGAIVAIPHCTPHEHGQ